MRTRKRRFCAAIPDIIILALLMLLLCPADSFAGPVNVERAKNVVAGWLKAHPRPLGTDLAGQMARIETFADDNARAIYYVVYLQPTGYVIVPADDALEPILCFVQKGTHDPSDGKPLAALVTRDIPTRIAAVTAARDAVKSQNSTGNTTPLQKTIADAQDKWDRLTASATTSVTIMALPAVSDARVAPLLQSTWGQTTVGSYIGGISCYNYYTPPGPDGDPCNYPTGCVAAAMAQLMRYHQHPTATYTWSDMPLQPVNAITLTQKRAIGRLCFDAAESINTVYAQGGSSASLGDAYLRLKDTFGYTNSVIAKNPATGTSLNNMVNTNLDAGLPVFLGLEGGAGHALVCDGYGYNASSLYHHLNLGWSGSDNAWYALPVVDTSPSSPNYHGINTCIYNIFTSGDGEIVSGRTTDMAGNPVPNVQIQAYPTGSATRHTTTDSKGIYAFENLPSNTFVILTAAKTPHLFANRSASTGRSSDYSSASGNVWAVNFLSTTNTPPIAHSQTTSATVPRTESITLYATDDGHPNPPARITYKIVVLPLHGTVSDPAGGKITAVPHTLANYGDTVNYRPCSYYSGQDTFYFAANDAGTPPQAGDSEPAAVTIDVTNVTYTTFAPQTGLIATWPLYTSHDDSRTQVIYLSSEIGGPKTITALALDVYDRPGRELNNWTIRIKHTTRNAYNSEPYFETTGWTIVYFNHEPRPTYGWYEFEFQTPFEYNGTSNLMIDFSHDNRSWADDGLCMVSDMSVPRVVLGVSDSMHGQPTRWDDDTFWPFYPSWSTGVPNIRLKSTAGGEPITGDFEPDCNVNGIDLRILSQAWLTNLGHPDWCPTCDISPTQDDFINELDFAVFAEYWKKIAE